MRQPLLSVIVPAKDQAVYIKDSMTSLTRQFQDASAMEVIVVDDGSSDGTGELAAAFADRLPDLTILRHDSPQGVASARNRGLDQATGRYITFLDPDDWYGPGYLPSLTDEIRQLRVDFLRADHIRHTGGTRTIHRVPQARRGVALPPREAIGPYNTSTMVDYCFPPFGIFDGLLKDAGLLHFLAGRHTAEDRPWVWGLHLKASSYAVATSLGAFYRRGLPGSLTQVFDRRQLDFIPCFREVFRLVEEDPEAERFWPKAVRQFLAISSHQLKRSQQMEKDYLQELHTGIRITLDRLPGEVAAENLALLDPARRALLQPALRRVR